jgi:hypothetical protein
MTNENNKKKAPLVKKMCENKGKKKSLKKESIEIRKALIKIFIKEFRINYAGFDWALLDDTRITPPSLETVRLEQKQIVEIGLNPILLSIICGTTFGDSNLCIPNQYKSARLSYRHSTRQMEWFLWKTLFIFEEFFSNEDAIQFSIPDGYQKEVQLTGSEILGKFKASTRVNVKLTELQGIIAPNNKKTIKRSWLNHMDNYFLMTLWLDDGSLMGELGRQGCFSTGSMPIDQAKILSQYFHTVWGFECRVTELTTRPMQNGHYPTRIDLIDQDNLMKLLTIIAPIIPVKSMLYKVCFFPHDVSLQQRWASDLKKLVRHEWHEELDKIYFYKKLQFYALQARKSEEDIVQ